MSGVILSAKWCDEPESLDEVMDRIVRCTPMMFVVYVNEASNKMVVKCEEAWMGLYVTKCTGFCSKPIDAIPVERLVDEINNRIRDDRRYKIVYKEYSRLVLCPVMRYLVALKYERMA